MDKLKRVRTAPTVLWRRARLQLLPLLVFSGVVALIVMQWHKLDGGGIPGLAEGVRSTVTAPQVGILQDVKVKPYQWVEAGQALATLVPVDPRSKLDLLQSELQIARLQVEPSLVDRNALDFERLRVESLRLQEELATADVNLQMAESALRRNELLRKDKLVSEDTYELSLRDRDMYKAEISEKRKSLASINDRLVKLRSVGEPSQPGTNVPVQTIVSRLDSRVLEAQTNLCPIPLVAPISGMVYVVGRQSGEYVVEGEPIIIITAKKSDRIVAYLRQPYLVEPETGMKVEVVTRTRQRQKFLSEVTQVGAQVEPITNALAVVKLGSLIDVGLPVVVNVPPGMDVRPGEAVDIIFRPESVSPSVGGSASRTSFSAVPRVP